MNNQEIANHLATLPKLAPNHYHAYRAFSNSVWTKGVLSSEEKEIIAVAVAHSTRCAYCIRLHTNKAKQLQIPLEALAEAVLVTGAIEAGTTLYAYLHNQELDQQSFPYHADPISTFISSIDESEFLTTRLKILIALSVAYALQSTKYITALSEKATQFDLTKEEIAEAAVVASALKAGGAISHLAETINEYQTDQQ